MEWPFITGVLGILFTIFFGILSILILRRKKYPGKINFIKEECIGLFDAFVKNFPEIEIKFKSNPISENVVYIKGSFINSGDIDIKDSMVVDQLKINLPDSIRWLIGRCTKAPQHIQNTLTLEDPQKMVFNLGLFKKEEVIQFEALAEVIEKPSRKNLTTSFLNQLSFSHRIADTTKVDFIEIMDPSTMEKREKLLKVLRIFGIVVIAMLSITFFLRNMESVYVINYMYTADNNEVIEIKVKPQEDGFLILEGINSDFKRKIRLEDFTTSNAYRPIISNSKEFELVKTILLFFILMPIGLLIVFYFVISKEIRTTKKIRRLLN